MLVPLTITVIPTSSLVIPINYHQLMLNKKNLNFERSVTDEHGKWVQFTCIYCIFDYSINSHNPKTTTTLAM